MPEIKDLELRTDAIQADEDLVTQRPGERAKRRAAAMLGTSAIPILISGPQNGVYPIALEAGIGLRVLRLVAKTDTGSMTVSVRIAGDPIAGLGAVGVTATKTTATATGGNVATATQELDMVLSGVSGPPGLLNALLVCQKFP